MGHPYRSTDWKAGQRMAKRKSVEAFEKSCYIRLLKFNWVGRMIMKVIGCGIFREIQELT